MRNISSFLLVLLALTALSSCAGNESAVVEGRTEHIKSLYVWEADGATDIGLLNALKGETMSYLNSKGFTISADPDKTDAYVKISVYDAERSGDKGRSYMRARLYILDASDNTIIYDTTNDAGASGGGFDGPEYPVRDFVEDALRDFVRSAGRE